MSSKHVLFRSEARVKVLKGAAALTDAVRVTLGPKSKCVLIENRWGKPTVCGAGDSEAIATRGAEIRRQIEKSTSDYDKDYAGGLISG